MPLPGKSYYFCAFHTTQLSPFDAIVRPVYITRLSKFLPNDPVSNDDMERVLGMVGGKPSRARQLVLRKNGIKARYYAYRDGRSTHSNAQLAANAVKALFDDTLPAERLELLTAGSTSPDQLLPSNAAMIHGLLGIHPIELISASGACCSSIQGLKYAFMSVGSGMTDVAASVGSEKISTWINATRYQSEADKLAELEANGYIAFEKDFLRWMLSDGAGAALLQSVPNETGISLKMEWLEIISYANEFETCMYAGAVKDETGNITGYNDLDTAQWQDDSVFALKQDTRLLGENVVPKGGVFLAQLMAKHGIGSGDIDYFLPHMSSEFFRDQILEENRKIGLDLPLEKWFYNLPRVGNVGAASAFLMLEELFHSSRLAKGDRLLVMVPESARFSYAYLYLTVV